MKENYYTISGQIVDVFNKRIFSGEVVVENGKIQEIRETKNAHNQYILPGFIDSHVHIESSMLTPSHFAEMVVPRGTIAVVSDPHEIANVMGIEGVQFMIDDSKLVPLKFFFGAPSCVPATEFETSGAILDSKSVSSLLSNPDIFFLSEMMNYPGVIYKDKEVLAKIKSALKQNKRIDGHAPKVTGKDLKKYVKAGITTDHECSTLQEALEKIRLGMKIQIREGSSARNFINLSPLLSTHQNSVMLCTDDSHPDEIENYGHIDRIIKLGLNSGYNVFDLLRAATITPVEHYKLPVGLLRVGDSADFIIVDNLNQINVYKSFINGNLVYDSSLGNTFSSSETKLINNFRNLKISLADLKVVLPENKKSLKVIEIEDGELITNIYLWKPLVEKFRVITSDIKEDILKIVVVNRYQDVPPTVGFIKNFGLKRGALASSVAHDSHNIVAVGVDDKSIYEAINLLIEEKGGICAVDSEKTEILKLPVAGLMSDKNGKFVSSQYLHLNKMAKSMGTLLKAPFMTLSFMSLLVIPYLKIGDKGLFDILDFEITDLFV